MSKFFMYGTELQDLEQMMMLIPNFIPRGSGVIVVEKVQNENKSIGCSDGNNYVGFQCSKKDCTCFAERLAAGLIRYEDFIKDCYKEIKTYHLRKRLARLVRNFERDIFLNPIHRSRFHTVCRIQNVSIENRNPLYLAVLFLLTADSNLWCLAKEHTYLGSFDFKKMHLNGINTDGYALYQTARTIFTGREYIKTSEIADETLIGKDTFKVIINAILIAKYGPDIFKVNC